MYNEPAHINEHGTHEYWVHGRGFGIGRFQMTPDSPLFYTAATSRGMYKSLAGAQRALDRQYAYLGDKK